MRILHDISPPLHPGIAVWPGDVSFRREVALDMADGAHLTLSSLTTTVHVGAHTDAPNHYRRDGQAMHERALDRYLGPCQVLTVEVAPATRVRPEHVRVPVTAPRVLFHTRTFPDPDQWTDDFAALSPELIGWLADEHGVVLVGLDTPSVDLAPSQTLEAHNAIADRDLGILEGVVLDGVPDGLYTLVALPLKLVGADASPVRAVLCEP